MKIEMFLFLIMMNFASEQKENDAENLILVKIEEDEYTKVHKTSQYIGVSYIKERIANWQAKRRSKNEKKNVYNGSYNDEEKAAHASDTLARKLMKNGERNHRLNFPDDDTEVYPEKKTTSSIYIGVTYNNRDKNWMASKWSKNEKKRFSNGTYKDEETAAHASDTLARNLMKDGEQNHKLNFPDDDIEVHPEKDTSSFYIGVCYNKQNKLWIVQRRSKREMKLIYNGSYKNEETAAHASDTLARKLMKNGEQNHRLNFTDHETERQTNKRKRSENEDLGHSQNKQSSK